MPLWLKDKLHMRRTLRQGLGGPSRARLIFTDHHESHAASAFFPSPFDEAAIVTLDGVGEWSTTTVGVGRGHRIELLDHIQFPHSLGLLYSAFTYYCGFKVNSGEYKLMGLAPYGRPLYKDLILERLIDLKPDGSLWLDMRYFNYCQGLTMTNRRFHDLFGGPPRSPETPLEPRHMDVAASIQAVTEEAVLRIGRRAAPDRPETPGPGRRRGAELRGQRPAAPRGGVRRPVDSAGGRRRRGALGAALFVWHQLLDHPRHPEGRDAQQGSFLGPRFTTEQVIQSLARTGDRVNGRRFADETELFEAVAAMLADGKVVGWFQGHMEFGPRAWGPAASWAMPGRRPCRRR